MKSRFVLLVLFTLLVYSCTSWKTFLVSHGNRNDAIQNAIIDYMHTCSLRKNDSVFLVNIYMENEIIIGLNIFAQSKNMLYPKQSDSIGNYSRRLPSRFIIYEGKLFYWYDPIVKLSQEIVNVLTKYNHIDSLLIDSANIYDSSPYNADERAKGVDYYFCKDDLRKYKKVVTRHAMGWYVPPKLKCNSCIKNKKSTGIEVSYTPGEYTVLRILNEKMYYVIFAQKNDSIYQIVSDKPFFEVPEGYQIKKGEKYDLKFTLLYGGRANLSCKKDYYYWKGSRLDLDAKTHFSIYHAENLKGLFLQE